MSTQPLTWQDAYDNDHYDAVTDDLVTHVPDRASITSGTSRSATGFDGPPPSRAAGGPAPTSSVASLATPPAAVTRDPEAADARAAVMGGSGANRKRRSCLCGRVGDPAFPWGYCPGGRDCLERIHAQEEEDRLTANQSGPHNEPQEAHMKDKPKRNLAASWR